jgi:signal transduction histidine kinase
VLADETQFGQLLQNLISNAIKFRAEDRAPRIRIAAAARDGMWIFSVEDNGIGIEEQYAGRIFQMFQRLHGRGEYEGSGIGLAIAKKIVERHSGQIWFTSQQGCGTTFFFSMPAAGGGAET